MRVGNASGSVWLREYAVNGAVRQAEQIEGVEYTRSVERPGKGEESREVSQKTPTRETESQLREMLSPEEEKLIYQLFPRSGVDWGARAYQRAQKIRRGGDNEGYGHIDLTA